MNPSPQGAFAVARGLLPKPLRTALRMLWVQQFRLGVTPDLALLSAEVSFSAEGRRWDTDLDGGIGGWVPATNHSHGYHGLLEQWWGTYGLGSSCLLISESCGVRASFESRYPETSFVATDFHFGLGSHVDETDVQWDLYEPAPDVLLSTWFGSVVCQATLEHLLDPVGVLRKFADLTDAGGHVFIHTHTPLYAYHGMPEGLSALPPGLVSGRH